MCWTLSLTTSVVQLVNCVAAFVVESDWSRLPEGDLYSVRNGSVPVILATQDSMHVVVITGEHLQRGPDIVKPLS